MSEEEKKAIEELKHYCNLTQYWKNVEYAKSEFDDYINTVLQVIETQQKEIEELKKYKRKHSLIKNHYISKDKIKSKIKEIKNDCKKCRFTGFCKDLLKNNQCSQGEAIKVLYKLLEE